MAGRSGNVLISEQSVPFTVFFALFGIDLSLTDSDVSAAAASIDALEYRDTELFKGASG